MSISAYAHIPSTTEISVILEESETGKYAVLSAGELTVVINSREKLLEIASLLENAAQKWKDENENDVELWECTKCGQISPVGRCCGVDTRTPAKYK